MAQPFGQNNTSFQHGYAARGKRPAVYVRWRNMISRCHAPSSKDYARYGAVGIEVCARWRFGENGVSGFILWMTDMGTPPTPNASIDRIDGAQGYTPANCRWATPHEQANNRKSNVWLTARGQTLTVAQWARMAGVGPKTIQYRLKAGASTEEAIFKVPHHGKKLKTLKEKRHD